VRRLFGLLDQLLDRGGRAHHFDGHDDDHRDHFGPRDELSDHQELADHHDRRWGAWVQ
jgi:hypothetical protein